MFNLNHFILLLLSNKAFSQVILSPSTVLLLNQPIKINCTSTINPPVWAFNGITIAGSLGGPCSIQSGGVDLITSVEAPNDKTCNLVISSVEMKHAGNYACADGNTHLTYFIAIVADRLKCESNQILTSISNPVSLKCSARMSYNGIPKRNFTWIPTFLTSATTSRPLYEYFNNISSSIIITQLNTSNPVASIPPYTCSIRLDKYNYSDSCSTSPINVHFPICCMKFSGNDTVNSIHHGDKLVCNVNSNPPAIFKIRHSNDTLVDGCTLQAINQMACPIMIASNYTCTAYTKGNIAGDFTINEWVQLDLTRSKYYKILLVNLLLIIPLLLFIIIFIYIKKKKKNDKSSTTLTSPVEKQLITTF